jgi:hypothetical protein
MSEAPEAAQSPTGTDGLVTGGLADESGGGQPNIAGCLYEAVPDFVGYRYECALEYDLTVRATVVPAVGTPFPVERSIFGLATANEGSYEHPLVMACCGELAPVPNDTCTTDHHRACFSDHLSQACLAAAALLNALGEDLGTGGGGLAVKDAAGNLRDAVNDCYNHFWSGPDDIAGLTEADSCTVAHNQFFDHTPFAGPGGTAGLVGVADVVVELSSRFGNNVVGPLPADPVVCESPGENDGDLPPLSEPGSLGSFVAPTVPVQVDIVGPQWQGQTISGSGEFATTSSLHRRWASTSSLLIDELIMVEDSPTTVGTSSIHSDIGGYILRLEDPVTATLSGKHYTVPSGAARFVLGATVDGQGNYLQSTNSQKIQFYTLSGGTAGCPSSVSQCLASRPFSIGYSDSFGGTWDLDVAGVVWTP